MSPTEKNVSGKLLHHSSQCQTLHKKQENKHKNKAYRAKTQFYEHRLKVKNKINALYHTHS